MDELHRLRPGMAVWDIGQRRIGTVAAVDASSFELRRPGEQTVCLRGDAIFWVGHSYATLVCHESHLNDYEA